MSIAETETAFRDTANADKAGGKILQFRDTLKAKTEAVSEWAHDRAGRMRGVVEQRPVATAGLSAGAAFVGGLAIGLLVAGRLATMRSSAHAPALPRNLLSRAQSLVPHDLAARIQRRF